MSKLLLRPSYVTLCIAPGFSLFVMREAGPMRRQFMVTQLLSASGWMYRLSDVRGVFLVPLMSYDVL